MPLGHDESPSTLRDPQVLPPDPHPTTYPLHSWDGSPECLHPFGHLNQEAR